MKIKDIFIVDIIDEDDMLNAIAKIDNFVVFIKGALKGEKVKIEIITIKKHYATAKIIQIIKKSKRRVECCDVYNKCGGCNFSHIKFDEELQIKTNYLNKLFNKDDIKIHTSNEYNYRNKATFHVKDNAIGYYSESTHDIVEFNKCDLLDKRINDIYNHLKTLDKSGVNSIIVKTTKKEVMIIINSSSDTFDYSSLISLFKVDSLYLNEKLIYGKSYITDEFNNLIYTIYPNAFYQVNTQNMNIMYDLIKKYAQTGNRLLDLYCGIGSISLYLKDNFKEVLGVEINKEAILNATINKNLNKANNVKFICADASIIKDYNFDVIVVDPPRSGLSKSVITQINKSNAKRVVYVSCNPKTLKRDIDLLDSYTLKNIDAINMFNKTKHVEIVCLLERK